ncbi:hypothetical protein FB45DRAFT_900986 [Roridomyces roridus]|uniref:Uncharacterized protein n=1 Tax=Roridomyces roridus TaxID=1738132 RepID=A0AAD7C8H9_9AGAR|nr:hypothetical protein FB45DRAFT_900986 [Roridomyces roridus]
MATAVPRVPTEVIDISDSSDEGPEATTTRQTEEQDVAPLTCDAFDSDIEEEQAGIEADHKLLIALSVNIKDDFEDALQDGFEFDGCFAYSKQYGMSTAPNPCLSIDGLGTIGIPLSEREARCIVAVTKSAADEGMWEIPPEKVHFDNPAWDAWIQKTAGADASTALTAYTEVKPAFSLKKLVIQEQSSFVSRHKEPISKDPSDAKIGDLSVILPSRFEGANLQLRHAGKVKSVNSARHSRLSTFIVAAFSGVEHILTGVTSGYRLSLLYDIIQPVTHAEERPMLPEMQGPTQKLHDILLSWKQDTSGTAPAYLACLLQHKYKKDKNFKGQSLTGADALLLSHLYPLARALKFHIHIAHVDFTVQTYCTAPGHGCGDGYGGRGKRRWYDDSSEEDESEIDEDEFHTDEDEEPQETLRVTQVVDLRGMPVQVEGLELHADDLVNGDRLTEGEPDTEDFDTYDERTSGSRKKVYKRSVLLIWPKSGDMERKVSAGDVYDHACNALRGISSVQPTKREKQLVENLLACCETRPKEAKFPRAVQALRKCAIQWKDARVLLRALKVCGADRNIDILGVEGFVSAYRVFGWNAVKGFYQAAVENDESNARSYALLARLTKLGGEGENAELLAWCHKEIESRLRSLGKIDTDQIPWLAELCLIHGGRLLKDVVLPQLQAEKLDQALWISFLKHLHARVQGASAATVQVVRALIVQCVTDIAHKLEAFPTKIDESTYSSASAMDCGAIVEVIKLCLETENAELSTGIFKKMREASQQGSFNSHFPPWMYYSEMCASLGAYLQATTGPSLTALFRPFFCDAVDAMVSTARREAPSRRTTDSICPLYDQHLATVMLAARAAEGISMLQHRLTADILKGRDTRTLQSLARAVMAAFSPQPTHDGSTAYNALMTTFACSVIDGLNMSAFKKDRFTKNPSEQLIALVEFCFEVGAQSQCERLLTRFTPPPVGVAIAQHVSDVLAPFLPVLEQYLSAVELDLRTEPYRTFAATVVEAFAEHVMSPRPTEPVSAAQKEKIGCGSCQECRELRAFFLSDRESIGFMRVQAIRTHLERQLAKTRAWGARWDTVASGSPHTLQVTKPASMTALFRWTENTKVGKSLLQTLGDPESILGSTYPAVYARIHNADPATATPLVNPVAHTTQKRAASPVASPTVAKKLRASS